MAKYTVFVSKSADKELSKLPVRIILQLQETILALADDPRPTGYKKLKGFNNFYRVRKGTYRVIYIIEDAILTVEVVRVGNRKDVYDN